MKSRHAVVHGIWSLIVYATHRSLDVGTGRLGCTGRRARLCRGTVVHINAGIAALACALALASGRIQQEPMAPHTWWLTVIGASLLWVGCWFQRRFRGGCRGRAGMAMAVRRSPPPLPPLLDVHEWTVKAKPSVLGIASRRCRRLVASRLLRAS